VVTITISVCLYVTGVENNFFPFLGVDLPQAPNVTIGIFADDTAVLTSHINVLRASTTLQEYLHIFNRWFQKWKRKVNETKSSYLTFTLRKDPSPPIYINEVEIPHSPH
jgi:hypothetical protein